MTTSSITTNDRATVCHRTRIVSFSAAAFMLVVAGLLGGVGGFSAPVVNLALMAGVMIGNGLIADRGPQLRLRDISSFVLDPEHPIGVRVGHVIASCCATIIIVSVTVSIVT